MNHGPLIKIQARTAADICAHYTLPSPAKKLLREGMSPGEFIAALAENNKYPDAITFMARALPVREAVWWGCLCMQHACGDNLAVNEREAAVAAVQWVMQPNEENRVAAKAPAGAAPPPLVAGALAMAAFQSGGNIASPNMPPQAPAPFAAAKSVALAVTLASVKSDPALVGKTQRCYLELGLEIAAGKLI